jgi:hypothetical protein
MVLDQRRREERTSIRAIAARISAVASRIRTLGMKRAAQDLSDAALQLIALADGPEGRFPPDGAGHS